MTLRRLPETLVNRIAAGEVVERPAAAVKELVENAIDAGAGRIEVVLRDGGRAFVAVTDDGCGMTPEELELAVERHATSKLPDDDLVNIATLGFRGEALPSIGAVSRLTVASRAAAAAAAWSLAVEGGRKGRPQPAALSRGTRVEVRDLFFATPARLKFLKSPRTETNHVLDALRRLAMAHPEVGFSLAEEGRSLLDLAVAEGALFEARLGRLAAIMGRDFGANALAIEAEREGLRLTGYIGLPTLNRGNAQHQYLFVNGRPVRAWRATAIPWSRSSSSCRPKRSTSTCIRPRPRCASASPGWCAACWSAPASMRSRAPATAPRPPWPRRPWAPSRRAKHPAARRRCAASMPPTGSGAAARCHGDCRRGCLGDWPRPRPNTMRRCPALTRRPRRGHRTRRRWTERTRRSRTIPWVRPAPSCTPPISWPRPGMASSSSTSTRPTSAWSTSA
jgi:DNA mismatch repair protein MutL